MHLALVSYVIFVFRSNPITLWIARLYVRLMNNFEQKIYFKILNFSKCLLVQLGNTQVMKLYTAIRVK